MISMSSDQFQALAAELDNLKLSEEYWIIFLEITRILFRSNEASNHYLKLRLNINSATLHAITSSLMHLGWVYFSLGVWYLSDIGKAQLQDISFVYR